MNQTQRNAPASLAALRDIVCHPLRIDSLIALTERNASVGELAKHFGADPGTTAYHVKKLFEAGAIEVVDTREGRGPDENVYRAVQRPLLDDDESAELSDGGRQEWVERIFALMVADATASMQTGTFSKRADHNIVRFPTSVDEQGWRELTEVYADALQRAMDIEAESAGRMVKSQDEAISARVFSMVFEAGSP